MHFLRFKVLCLEVGGLYRIEDKLLEESGKELRGHSFGKIVYIYVKSITKALVALLSDCDPVDKTVEKWGELS